MYLKLAVPGCFALLFEWTNFEIGTFASGNLKFDKKNFGIDELCRLYFESVFENTYD
jgi:hypothetical protein